ncbi:MAG: hypothetical protein QE274_02755, partial [Verrucomicrobiaceae bacterium]|nr:hypothetical protein [Verrucomicrobiaceae bacterium]
GGGDGGGGNSPPPPTWEVKTRFSTGNFAASDEFAIGGDGTGEVTHGSDEPIPINTLAQATDGVANPQGEFQTTQQLTWKLSSLYAPAGRWEDDPDDPFNYYWVGGPEGWSGEHRQVKLARKPGTPVDTEIVVLYTKTTTVNGQVTNETGKLTIAPNQMESTQTISAWANAPTGGQTSEETSVNLTLLPVEIKVVNRDDPKNKWADATDNSSGKPIYAGESCGDMVSWKLGGSNSWTNTTLTWTAEGPNGETIAGPTGPGKNEWKIADGDDDTANDWLKWKPGKWKIKIKIGSTSAEFEQVVGTRTEQYFAVGTIPVETVSTTGVAENVITQWECPGINYSILALIGGGVNSSQSSFFIPFDEPNRVYVNHRLLNSSRNLDPIPAIRPDEPVTNACGLDPIKHFREFAACQMRFLAKDGKLDSAPELIPGNHADLVGHTPIPCQSENYAGPKGETHPDSGKVTGNKGDEVVSYLTKFRVGKGGQFGFTQLNGREIPWVFFRFRFEAKDGLIDTKFDAGQSSDPNGPDTKDFSTVPTWLIYRRYYDLDEKLWKVEQVRKINETRRPFFSIGVQVPGSAYVLP